MTPGVAASRQAGVHFVQQHPIEVDATVQLGADRPVCDAVHDLVDFPPIQQMIISGVRERLNGLSPADAHDALNRDVLDAADADLQALCLRVAKGQTSAAWELLATLRRLGTGRSPTHDCNAIPALLEFATRAPVIGVQLESEWFDRRREQREVHCESLARLAQGCAVQLIGSRLDLVRLAHQHHADLPSSVREQVTTGGVAQQVEDVVFELDPDSRAVELLRFVADTTAETVPYERLYNTFDVSSARVRQLLSQLREHGLVSERFETAQGSAVELLHLGSEVLDALDDRYGQQAALGEAGSERVSETGKSFQDMPCNHAHAREGGEEDPAAAAGAAQRGFRRERLPSLHHPQDWNRAEYVAARECAPDGGVAVVDHPVAPRDDRAEGHVWVDQSADAVGISTEFDSPMPYWVSTAIALTDWRVWEFLLPEDRLDDDEDFAQLFYDDRQVLRGARCLGHLSDDLEDADEYIDALQQARDNLYELTKRWHEGDYEDRDRFRGAITRDALGLAGTMIHLLDLVGVDVTLEVRVPELPKFDTDHRRTMARSLSLGLAICSCYGQHVGYRQLFETREEKLEWTTGIDIDHSDPLGDVIPSVSVVGNCGDAGAESLASILRTEITAPRELRDDAAEIAVDVPVVDDLGRGTYANVVRELASAKTLRATREAISLFHGLAATPYDAAVALGRGLSAEGIERDIRPDEVRRALRTLDSDGLLAGASPTVRDVIATLLDAQAPLSQAELAERAGRSPRSVRSHLPRLEALGLVEETPQGYRLTLSFCSAEERHSDILPRLVADDLTLARDAVYDAIAATETDPPGEWHGPWVDHGGDPKAIEALAERFAWVEWALQACQAFAGQAEVETDSQRTARFGADLEAGQRPIGDSINGAAA